VDAEQYRQRAVTKMEHSRDPIPDLLMALSLDLGEVVTELRYRREQD
jgi:hypothetical protein